MMPSGQGLNSFTLMNQINLIKSSTFEPALKQDEPNLMPTQVVLPWPIMKPKSILSGPEAVG